MTSEPCASGCINCSFDTFPSGRKTIEFMPAEAQYAARLAEVSPVEAHATALMLAPSAIICFTCETSTVMPRSLNDPVWLLPHSFIQRPARPISLPSRSAQKRFDSPSYIETRLSTSTRGLTHSLNRHTPEPYGHEVRCLRSSKSFFHSSPVRSVIFFSSWLTCNSEPHFSQL